MKTFHDNETVRTAHELRTPLHGILGLARQGLAAGTPEEKDACLAAVLWAGDQLMELVNGLLSPADGPKAADYDLRDLADGVETLLRAYAGADRTVTVTVQDSAPRRLNGDAGAIRQILLNLGGNAVKYAAPGPVEITLSVDDAGVLTAAVADHGPGIPPEKLENLFCPGVRDAAGEGTGLGLAVSRSLAESMGGTLTAHSRVGQGSVFTLRVPQKPARAVHPWKAPDARVLIADDSPISLLATAGLLRTWAIDPVTVLDEMKALGYKEAANRDFFLQLIDTTPTAANVEEYADIIRSKSMLRELQTVSSEIIDLTRSEEEDADTVADLAEQKIYAVRQGREVQGFTSVNDAIQDVYAHLDELAANPGKLPGLPTGFSMLDQYIGGLNKSDLILLAARPGMGKTAIALNMALTAAKKSGKTVVIFQLEMSKEQLATRLLSNEALVDSKKLRMGNLDDDDWQRMAGATQVLQGLPILLDENSGITVPEMKAKCRRLGGNLGLIVIDYLQLMHAPKHTDNRVQEVAEISRSLKIMAKELNVPVLCCSQLSRGPESRSDKRPMLSDLRESGSIEQDADIVLFIYRDDYYNDNSEAKNSAELIVAKNRHGETGKVDLQWMGQFTSFASQETLRSENG